VAYPRLFAYPGGLPLGFADGVAPLLVWLDRNHLGYDVTTDLALALGDGPTAQQRKGILFAGAPEWVSRGLARRLRRYVADGGRVALFGPKAMRAGVTVGDRRLTRPTPPGTTDAFGARLSALRTLAPGPDGAPVPPLTVLDDDPQLGLLTGFSGQLSGFTKLEELISPGPRAEVRVRVGEALTDQELADAEAKNEPARPERASLSATQEGKGLVIRIGLPEWAQRLAGGDPAVAQITRNVVDLVHGVRPRPRSAAG
jgi:hypothetical protein